MRPPFRLLSAPMWLALAPIASCAPEPRECADQNVACGPLSGCEVEESSLMLPGANCLACHAPGILETVEDDDDLDASALRDGDDDDDDGDDDDDDGDDDDDDGDDEDLYFTAAGTVYGDEEGTAAAGGAIVRIVDAAGTVVELTSNSAGNFYTAVDLVFPIDAEVEKDGQLRWMERSVDSGACNDCHHCSGEAEAKLYVR